MQLALVVSFEDSSGTRSPIRTPILASYARVFGGWLCPVTLGGLFSTFTMARIGAATPVLLRLRFNTDVRPCRCASEQARIELKLAPLSTLWLHGSRLVLEQAFIETGGAKLSSEWKRTECSVLDLYLSAWWDPDGRVCASRMMPLCPTKWSAGAPYSVVTVVCSGAA